MIDLAEDEDQALIAETARRVLTERRGESWQECAELGWLALALPEDAGGVGLGRAEQAVLFRELGRELVDGPFLDTALAAEAALAVGDEPTATALAQGRKRAALATEIGAGRVRWWAGAVSPGVLLVRAQDGGSYLLDADALDEVDALAGVDDAFRLVTADGAAAPAPVPDDVARRLEGAVRLLTAAMLSGIAQRTLEMSVGYGRDRVQYGKPIGSFQVIKHRCADMAVRAEAAWAATALAAVTSTRDRSHAAFDATAAWMVARAAALANARDNVQNHGAIGFTAEHSAQRYVKRAHVWGSQPGSGAVARQAMLAAPDPW